MFVYTHTHKHAYTHIHTLSLTHSYVYEYFASLFVCELCVCLEPEEIKRDGAGESSLSRLKLQTVVDHHVGAGN